MTTKQLTREQIRLLKKLIKLVKAIDPYCYIVMGFGRNYDREEYVSNEKGFEEKLADIMRRGGRPYDYHDVVNEKGAFSNCSVPLRNSADADRLFEIFGTHQSDEEVPRKDRASEGSKSGPDQEEDCSDKEQRND